MPYSSIFNYLLPPVQCKPHIPPQLLADARSSKTPLSQLRLIHQNHTSASHDTPVILALARNPHTPAAILQQLRTENLWVELIRAVCANPRLPMVDLHDVSLHHPIASVRKHASTIYLARSVKGGGYLALYMQNYKY